MIEFGAKVNLANFKSQVDKELDLTFKSREIRQILQDNSGPDRDILQLVKKLNKNIEELMVRSV